LAISKGTAAGAVMDVERSTRKVSGRMAMTITSPAMTTARIRAALFNMWSSPWRLWATAYHNPGSFGRKKIVSPSGAVILLPWHF
jgi:hypothetical protein